MHPGNTIKVSGGLAKQRELAYCVATHCIEQLLPRHRTLWIEIDFRDLDKNNVLGYCYKTDHNYYTLELDKYQNVYDLIVTTCHEMVHVKQGVREELTERHLVQFWKGEEHKDRDPNAYGPKQPWEREAWKMQKVLAHSFIKEYTEHTISYIKSMEERCMELY